MYNKRNGVVSTGSEDVDFYGNDDWQRNKLADIIQQRLERNGLNSILIESVDISTSEQYNIDTENSVNPIKSISKCSTGGLFRKTLQWLDVVMVVCQLMWYSTIFPFYLKALLWTIVLIVNKKTVSKLVASTLKRISRIGKLWKGFNYCNETSHLDSLSSLKNEMYVIFSLKVMGDLDLGNMDKWLNGFEQDFYWKIPSRIYSFSSDDDDDDDDDEEDDVNLSLRNSSLVNKLHLVWAISAIKTKELLLSSSKETIQPSERKAEVQNQESYSLFRKGIIYFVKTFQLCWWVIAPTSHFTLFSFFGITYFYYSLLQHWEGYIHPEQGVERVLIAIWNDITS